MGLVGSVCLAQPGLGSLLAQDLQFSSTHCAAKAA